MGLESEIPCGSHPHRATVQFTATHWSPNSEKTSLLLFTLTPGMLSLTLWASSHPPMHSCLPTLCCLLSLHSWTCQHKAKGTAFFPLLQSLSGNCHDLLLALPCLSLQILIKLSSVGWQGGSIVKSAKSDDLSSTPRIYMVEESRLLQTVL